MTTCPPPFEGIDDAVGRVLLAAGVAMPFVPCDSPYQLGQELLPLFPQCLFLLVLSMSTAETEPGFVFFSHIPHVFVHLNKIPSF